MAIIEPNNCEWRVFHTNGETRIFWKGHYVGRDVTSVEFKHRAGEKPEMKIGVLASLVEATITVKHQTEPTEPKESR